MKIALFITYTLLTAWVSLSPVIDSVAHIWDKALHYSFYALYAIIGSRQCKTDTQLILMCLGITAYGGLLEVGQHFIPDREMSFYDGLANALGITFGALLARYVIAPLEARSARP